MKETSTPCELVAFPRRSGTGLWVFSGLSLAHLWCGSTCRYIIAEALGRFPGALIFLPGSWQRTAPGAFFLEFFCHHTTKGRPSETALFFVVSCTLSAEPRTRGDLCTEKRWDKTELRCSSGVLLSGLTTHGTNAKTLGMSCSVIWNKWQE